MISASHTNVSIRRLLQLAWPLVVMRSTQAVIGLCDALMSAPLGESALAAVTTGAMNCTTISILPIGLVLIAQSFSAQYYGRRDLDAAVRYAWYALLLSLATFALSLICLPWVGSILDLIGYAPAVHRSMTDYLELRLLGTGAAVAMEALGAWYGGIGNTRIHMVAGLVVMVLNVLLNWLLIFGKLGFPALGVRGAALASVIATFVGMAIVLLFFLRRVGIDVDSVRPHKLKLAELARMLRFGLPAGISWFLEFAAFALFANVLVAGLGTTTLAAMMVVININSVSFMPAFGLSVGGAILAGQAIGAAQHQLVALSLRRTVLIAAIWQLAVGLSYLLFPRQLIGFFAYGASSASAELLTIGSRLLMISAAWQLFDAIAMGVSETLRAAGDTKWTLWARVVIAWLVFTPAAYLTIEILDGGYIAAVLCLVGYLLLVAVALVWRFAGGRWKSLDLTGEAALDR